MIAFLSGRFFSSWGLALAAAALGGLAAACGPIPATPSVAESKPMTEAPVQAAGLLAIDTAALRRYLLGKFDPAADGRFVALPAAYATGGAVGAYMRREAFDAFSRMHDAARQEGVSLTILSATRNFSRQKQIWEDKWSGRRLVEGKNLAQAIADPAERAAFILRYSSMPGSSRHHWGTDVDLNALENSYFRSGQGKKIYDWLTAHAGAYGFCQVYSAFGADRSEGYQEEMWHWSYLPIAADLLKAYAELISPSDFEGFEGAQTAADLRVIDRYVMGISRQCQ